MPKHLTAYWHNVAKEWGRTSLRPYIHPEDLAYLEKIGYWKERGRPKKNLDFHSFVRDASFGRIDSEFCFSLLPLPYIGNLAKADIFILLLNPGFDYVDLYAQGHRNFRRSAIRNLQQEFEREEFPFAFLNPTYCWHGGFVYWGRRLRGVLKLLEDSPTLMSSKGNDGHNGYYKALKAMANRVAAIELVPYHSRSFNAGRLAKGLPSAKAARTFVTQYVAPKVLNREALLIVTRSSRYWGLGTLSGSYVCYAGYETRGAFLTPKSRGGKAILKWIEDHPQLAEY